MYIERSTSVNGNATTIHRVLRTEMSGTTNAFVTIASYRDDASEDVLGIGTYSVPVSALSGSDFVQSLHDWIVSDQGPQPGGIIHEGDDALTHAKKIAMASIAKYRDLNISGGCVVALGQVDTDEVSLRNIQGACQIATMAVAQSQPFEIGWKYSDNVIRIMDALQTINMGVTVMQHVSACYTVSWNLKDAVNTAETVEEVNSIDIENAWSVIPTSPAYVAPEEPEEE